MAKASEKSTPKAAKAASPRSAAVKKASAAKVKAAKKAVVKTPAVESKPAASAVTVKHQEKKTGVYFYANGKRKCSVATVRLYKDGKGAVTINNRTFENFFPVFTDQDKVLSPLRITSNLKVFDVTVMVHGGGVHSQAEAIRHGVAKALLEFDAALRPALKHAGYLTRDPRVKERKKYGLKRARRAPQWQKR